MKKATSTTRGFRAAALLLCAAPVWAATVTDSATGLTWDACALGQTATGGACIGTPAALTWQQALQAAGQANSDLYQGHADWRVPNRTELESTVDLAVPGAGVYWSSTSYHPAPAQAWTVDFSDGASHPAAKSEPHALRLVRGGGDAAYALPGPASTPALPLPSQPGQTAQAEVSGGGTDCGFTSSAFISPASLPTPPAHVTPVADLFEFVLDGCTPGGTVQITLTYPQALPAAPEPGQLQFWKYGPRPGRAAGWYAYPHVTFNGNTVTLTLTDGALGDDDLDAGNGRIVDAGGPMHAQSGAVAVPTLSQWSVLLLSALLVGIADFQRRLGKRRQPQKGLP